MTGNIIPHVTGAAPVSPGGHMIARSLCLVFLAGFLVSCSSPSVRVHPRSSEAKIRNVILRQTPLGSSSASVLSFINTRLHHEGPAELRPVFHDKEGHKIIENLEVGWHWSVVPLTPAITYVYVSWTFDSKDRLIDVSVSKEIDAV